MPPLNPTVIVMEPDPAIRASLDGLIRRAGWFPRLFVSAEEFLASRTPIGPSCLLLRVDQAEVDGIGLVRRTVAERPEMPVIAVAVHHNVPQAVRAMKAGADDYLLQPVAEDALLDVLSTALLRSETVLKAESELRSLRDRHRTLSAREREVMAQVVAGLLNKQVGAVLGISEITVKAHRGKVMRKMGADSLAQLVSMSLRLNLPPAPRDPLRFVARRPVGEMAVLLGA